MVDPPRGCAGPQLPRHIAFGRALRHARAYIVNLAVLGEPIGACLHAMWLFSGGEVPGPTTVGRGSLFLAVLDISIQSRHGAGT